ncbi:Retrotransposon-derived protein PEG10 [Takifugu flavidus]|uniref:Retrotransposon-derived protein PEG10 n=1 Tax=Takifugu flavidus TaxID=433684 RepID=A0A5C6MW70_9TELE|nr:Retrotransposon-derived protein PEG10 [Takifugu flavidus]
MALSGPVQQLVVSVSQLAAPVPAPQPGTAPEPWPYTFASVVRDTFTINHLTGRARLCRTAEWERGMPACSSFQAFSAELRKGSQPVADYAIDFRTRARLSDWNSAAQCDAFLHGLAPYIKDELVFFNLPPSLDGLIELTSRLDRHIHARRRELRQEGAEHRSSARLRGSPATPNHLTEPSSGGAEPVQLGRTSPTPEERERRCQGNLCLYCGQAGHFVSRCPVKGEGSTVNGGVLLSRTQDSAPCPRPLFHCFRLLLAGGSHTLTTFIDSGADVSLIDEELAVQLGIDQVPLLHSVPASALDGHLLGTITHQTTPIHMLLSGNHHETIHFHILKSPHLPLILGYPWLHRYNPHIDWATEFILGWSSSCHQIPSSSTHLGNHQEKIHNKIGVTNRIGCGCRLLHLPPRTNFRSKPAKGGDDEDTTEFFTIGTAKPPSDNLQYSFLINTSRQPPGEDSQHCAIDLLPGTTPLKDRLYSLSVPEREAMEAYINDALAAGIICPSSSPAGAGFFFVEKKDRSLRPCIDYRGFSL